MKFIVYISKIKISGSKLYKIICYVLFCEFHPLLILFYFYIYIQNQTYKFVVRRVCDIYAQVKVTGTVNIISEIKDELF